MGLLNIIGTESISECELRSQKTAWISKLWDSPGESPSREYSLIGITSGPLCLFAHRMSSSTMLHPASKVWAHPLFCLHSAFPHKQHLPSYPCYTFPSKTLLILCLQEFPFPSISAYSNFKTNHFFKWAMSIIIYLLPEDLLGKLYFNLIICNHIKFIWLLP